MVGINRIVSVLGVVLVLGVLAIAVRPARAQESATLQDVKTELPADAATALERAVERARTRGLPTQPLLNKALEGTAKAVPADRILAVVDRLVDQLDRSRALLENGAAPSPADVTAVADALQRGVPAEAIEDIRSRTPDDQSVGLAVHTVADLLDRSVPVDRALDVLQAWNGGEDAGELRELPAAVDRLIRQGVRPEQAASAVAAAVRAGRPPSAVGPPPDAGAPGVRHGSPSKRPPIPSGAGPPSGVGKTGHDTGSGNGSGG